MQAMKLIVTHASPDWDAITSVWLLKRFLPGWDQAKVEFVPAGERLKGSGLLREVVEKIDEREVIHVDTGLGPLDHHQIQDRDVSAASRTWEYVKNQNADLHDQLSERVKDKMTAIDRMVKIVVDTDHFKEIFWKDPLAHYHDFSVLSVLDGLKFARPNQDEYYVTFGMDCLDYLLHYFENRIWAEREIAQDGHKFQTSIGRGIAFETLNDTVLKLAQKMGYDVVVRKDPRKGYVRIKARPCEDEKCKIDLTSAYEKLKKLDPDATWFLHVSRHMLLNGTPKNPKMRPTKLSLDEIVEVLKSL